MAESEPLSEEGSPPHRESSKEELEMEDKMSQIKKIKKGHLMPPTFKKNYKYFGQQMIIKKKID